MPSVVDAEGRPRRSLPAGTLQRLQERPSLKGADAHAFAIMMSMVNAGHTEPEAYGLLVDVANPGGWAVQRRHVKNAGSARRWVHEQWQKARAKVQANPAVGDQYAMQAELARIAHAVEDRVDLWGGPGGASRRRVIEAVLYFAVLAKNSNVRISERQIGEHLQMRQATVNAALKWHREQGVFLKRLQVGAGFEGSLYNVFYSGRVQGRISSSPSAQVRGTDTTLAPTADLWSFAGLGQNARGLLLELPPAPSRAKFGVRGMSPSGDMVRKSSTSPKGDVVRTSDSREAKENAASLNDAGHVPGLCSNRGECRCKHVVRLPDLLLGPTVTELSASTGLSRTTVRRHLEKLARLDMVAADGHGHWAKLPYEEHALAAELNVLGNGQRRAQHFANERSGWQRREASKRGLDIVQDDLGTHYVSPRTGEVVSTTAKAEQVHHGQGRRLA